MSNTLHQGLSKPPSHTINFIVEPLQKLLQDRSRQPTDILDHLTIVDLRFKQCYVNAVHIDWTQELRTDVTFWEDLRYMSSRQLYDLRTRSDEELFRILCEKDIINYSKNERVAVVSARWNKLCRDVWEYVIIDRRLGCYIRELAEVY